MWLPAQIIPVHKKGWEYGEEEGGRSGSGTGQEGSQDLLGSPSNGVGFGGTQGKKGLSWRRGGAARNSSRSDLTNSLDQKSGEMELFLFSCHFFSMSSKLVNFSKRHFEYKEKKRNGKIPKKCQ